MIKGLQPFDVVVPSARASRYLFSEVTTIPNGEPLNPLVARFSALLSMGHRNILFTVLRAPSTGNPDLLFTKAKLHLTETAKVLRSLAVAEYVGGSLPD